MRVECSGVALTLSACLAGACSSGVTPLESVGQTHAAIATSDVIDRGMEWVNASLHYCQAAYGAVDGDSSCWAWEGSSHTCDRASNAEWNAYRSDCSGFITWAWGLPPVGDGGYTTGEFAPYGTSFSHTISGSALEPGDALNKTPSGHIILFEAWVTPGQTALFMEEPGCSSSEPYAHEFTSAVSISGDEVYVSYEGATFYAIRYDDVTVGTASASASATEGESESSTEGTATSTETSSATAVVPGGSGGGSGAGSSSSASSAPDACDQGPGFCTATLQCDNGRWTVRQDDPTRCATVEDVQEPCPENGYCSATLQCDNGFWVARSSDPMACTSGPG
jgi:hypothetical protein